MSIPAGCSPSLHAGHQILPSLALWWLLASPFSCSVYWNPPEYTLQYSWEAGLGLDHQRLPAAAHRILFGTLKITVQRLKCTPLPFFHHCMQHKFPPLEVPENWLCTPTSLPIIWKDTRMTVQCTKDLIFILVS